MKFQTSLLAFAMLAACATPAPQAEQVIEREAVITGGYAKADESTVAPRKRRRSPSARSTSAIPRALWSRRWRSRCRSSPGLDYAFDITMTGGSRFKVVVYRDLQNQMKVTNYEKVG